MELRKVKSFAGWTMAAALALTPALLDAQLPACAPVPTAASIAAAAQKETALSRTFAHGRGAARGRAAARGGGGFIFANLYQLAEEASVDSSRSMSAGRGGPGGASAGEPPCYNTVPPQLPADLDAGGGVLIFSKTNGYRDEPSMEASNAALAALAKGHDWPFFVTENGAVMNPAQLKKFKVVIWNNNSGDTLNPDQRAAFKAWVEDGGTYIGIHGAGGDPPTAHPPLSTTLAAWPWYINGLLGAQFTSHATMQPGIVDVQAPSIPIMKGLPLKWYRTDEWYAFATNPRKEPGFHVLATADETSYYPGHSTMWADHPLIWWHCVGQGHMLFSALGHAGWEYAQPNMLQLLDNSMTWGMTVSGHGCS